MGANPSRLPDWLDGTLSAWLLFWASLIVVCNHAGAYAYVALAVLLGAVGWLVLIRRTALRGRAILFGLAWSFLFLWMVVTTRWGEFSANTAWRLGVQLVLMLSLPAFFATRSERVKSTLSHILMATALGGVAVMVADLLSGFGLTFTLDPLRDGQTMWRRQSDAEMHLGRGLVAWSILTPTLLALFATRLSGWARWAVGLTFVGLLFAAAGLNRLFVPVLIMAGSVPVFFIALKAPKLALRGSVWLAAASILFAPIVGWLSRFASEDMLSRLPLSWDHRLRMWDYTFARILEKPLTGHGLDASRGMQDSFTTRIGVDIPYISLHPHNVGLQVWLELGAVGALFAAGAIFAMGPAAKLLAARNPYRMAALAALITGAAIASAITVGAWQYWWWGLIGFAGASVAFIPEKPVLLKRSVDA